MADKLVVSMVEKLAEKMDVWLEIRAVELKGDLKAVVKAVTSVDVSGVTKVEQKVYFQVVKSVGEMVGQRD